MKKAKTDLLYKTIKPPLKLYLDKKFNIYKGVNELASENGPYLMLGHHVTAFDPLFTNVYSNNTRIRYLSGDANYDNYLKKFLLNLTDCIPFSKNKSDIASIMRLKRKIKNGYPIGLYPEGGRNWDGSTDYIIPSTSKLIKLLKVPVYISIYRGGYLSKPRWAQYFRKGKLIIDIKKLFEPDELKMLSSEEIHTRLKDALTYNEYEWQADNMIPYKGKRLAEHIERLLYKCPNCGCINSFISKNNSFTCKDCNITYSINKYGFIEDCEQFNNTASWNAWQKTFINEIAESDFEFHNKSIPIRIFEKEIKRSSTRKMNLRLTNEKIILYDNEDETTIPIKKLFGLSITFLDVCEFFYDDKKYRLFFNPKKHMSVKLFYDLIIYLKGGRKEDE